MQKILKGDEKNHNYFIVDFQKLTKTKCLKSCCLKKKVKTFKVKLSSSYESKKMKGNVKEKTKFYYGGKNMK